MQKWRYAINKMQINTVRSKKSLPDSRFIVVSLVLVLISFSYVLDIGVIMPKNICKWVAHRTHISRDIRYLIVRQTIYCVTGIRTRATDDINQSNEHITSRHLARSFNLNLRCHSKFQKENKTKISQYQFIGNQCKREVTWQLYVKFSPE